MLINVLALQTKVDLSLKHEHPMIIITVVVKRIVCMSLPFIIGESLLITLTQGLNLPPFKPITGFLIRISKKSNCHLSIMGKFTVVLFLGERTSTEILAL